MILSPWLAALGACVMSTVMSVCGLSGAFLLLPFQVSVLGFADPAVTPTNHLYNVVAIPGGVFGYWREQRMLWPLAWVAIAGTRVQASGSIARRQHAAAPRRPRHCEAERSRPLAPPPR